MMNKSTYICTECGKTCHGYVGNYKDLIFPIISETKIWGVYQDIGHWQPIVLCLDCYKKSLDTS